MKSANLRVWSVRLVAGLVLLNGLAAVFQALALDFDPPLLLGDLQFISRSVALAVGALLIFLAFNLLRRRQLSWYIALSGLLILAISHLIHYRQLGSAFLPLVTVLVLLASREEFVVETERESFKRGCLIATGSLLGAIVYGSLGFWLLDKRQFGLEFNLLDSIRRTLREFALLGNPDLIPHTLRARWFLHSIDLIGIIGLGLAVVALFRPVLYRLRVHQTEVDRARQLLRRYGDSSEDFFKLWPSDKSYFWSANQEGFIAYRVTGGVAFALADPVGPPALQAQLLQDFQRYAKSNGWAVAFLHTARPELYQAAGYRLLNIGQNAIIELPQLAQIARSKHFRQIQNKFTRLGYQVELCQPPHSAQLLQELAEISQSWLEQPGRRERGLALGYFDAGYLQQCRLFVARDRSGQAMAFANQPPSYSTNRQTVDLMRYRPGSPTGLMDYLFLMIMLQLQAAGHREFDLGLAPLAGLAQQPGAEVEERLLAYIYHHIQMVFSFRGLRQFKSKFKPQWQPSFLAYSGSRLNLARIAFNLERALRR